ncbi:nitrous oxide reductase accessory protein NosL [Sulfurimonas sp.]
MFFNRLLFLAVVVLFSFTSIIAQTDYSDIVKEKKIYPTGKKIYKKMCKQDVDLSKYTSIEKLKNAITNEKICKPLKDKYLEYLSIYLWDTINLSSNEAKLQDIKISKTDKCPVCGMYVYKYPKWAAQIFYKEKHYLFDGVKDLMKYYFENKENIQTILVRDYYTQKTIDATKAYYVIGSDVYGPMGNELIPFKKLLDAKTFYMDHRATKIIEFKNITQTQVDSLD